MKRARIRENGEVAGVLFYDPADPQMAYKLQLSSDQVDWFSAEAVEPLDDVMAGAQPGTTQAEEGVRRGPEPPPPAPPPLPPSPPPPARLAEPLLPRHRVDRNTHYQREMMDECLIMSPQCIRCCIPMVFIIAAATIGFERNAGCSPEALSSVPPPYGGELMPANITLVERNQYFQITKLVDVYDATDGKHVGYFYDMNLLFWLRFGFSDASDRIWFEARYPTLYARMFQLGVQYYLQRCDVGAGGRAGGVFDIKEDYWSRPWFCYNNCYKAFNVTRRPANGAECSEGASCNQPVADAIFNSTTDWYKNGVLWAARHRWYMDLSDPADGSTLAFAQQHFVLQNRGFGSIALSRWNVDVEEEKPYLPNWVVGFMAALDDVTED